MTDPRPTATRYDVATFGETLLRISVPPGIALETADRADLHAAGSESNVAAALSGLGRHVAFASRLPDSPPGRRIANSLRRAGIDLSHLTWCDSGRVGTFYVELTPPPAAVRVIYDRADSCATRLSPENIDFDRLLNTRVLHLSGITPALSGSCRAATQAAVQQARRRGVPVSFDINYRRKLWPPDDARDVLLPLVKDAALLFVAESDSAEVFCLDGTSEKRLTALVEMTGAARVVLTIGSDGLLAWDGGQVHHQPARPTPIIDRLGAGDALAAGVIHGWLDDDFVLGLRAGAALAGLCLRRHGDIVTCTPGELRELLETDPTDRPQR